MTAKVARKEKTIAVMSRSFIGFLIFGMPFHNRIYTVLFFAVLLNILSKYGNDNVVIIIKAVRIRRIDMKFTKAIQTLSVLSLMATAVYSVYTSVQMKKTHEELLSSNNEIKRRLLDVRTTVGILSAQVKSCQSSIESLHGEAKESCLCGSENHECDDMNNEDQGEFCSADENGKECYIVREYNGLVGVFGSDEDLMREENIMVATLSDADRQSLALGIRVQSQADLDELIEDLK